MKKTFILTIILILALAGMAQAAPVITSISPTTVAAPGSVTLIIRGSGFTAANKILAVNIYNKSTGAFVLSAKPFTINSTGKITATASLAAGTYYAAIAWGGISNPSPTVKVSGTPPPPPPPAPPVASFIATPNSGPAPLLVNYVDSSTGSPTSWLWTFGDGSTATAQHPSNTFVNAGTYTTTLKVSNAGGSSTASRVITVTGVTPPLLPPPRQPLPGKRIIPWGWVRPCIDKGANVGATIDILGNPIVGKPDMGAYEKQP